MITAKKANELVAETTEREIKEKRELAERFCEELSKKIEAAAKEKHYEASTMVSPYFRDYVIEILKSNGFVAKVDTNNPNYINISWYC